jgi:spore coat polysaccharide biosynthesis predicted glycosyltransferase SpsG
LKSAVICRAGPSVGLGHLKRSLRIASSLEHQFGAVVDFMVWGTAYQDSISNADRVASLFEDEASLVRSLDSRTTVDLVILDLPPGDLGPSLPSYIAEVRSLGGLAISIDNPGYESIVDLTFVPSFRRPKFESAARGSSHLVFGWDCFLLDDNPIAFEWHPGPRVLALTGGSDAANLGDRWPTILDSALPTNAELHWVTGPFSARPDLSSCGRLKVTEHLAPNDLRPLMQSANYAVTVYGVSFFELLQQGIPTVVFSPYDGRDTEELEEIRRLGLAVVADDDFDAATKLNDLMSDHSLARELSVRGAERLRRPGTDRLYKEIKRLLLSKRAPDYPPN